MIEGKDIITLVQAADDSNGALVVANLTENSHSIENELIDEQTKFGRVLGYGQNSEEMDITCYGERGDAGQKAVIDAIKNKKKLKVWEVDREKNENDAYDAVFAYAFVESVEKSSEQDGFQEIEVTLQIEGESQEGELTTLPEGALPGESGYDFEEPATSDTAS